MGTGSSVVRPEVEDGQSSRQVTIDSKNNNIPKRAQGIGVSHSLQVKALLTLDYKEEKPSAVPRRAISFQIRRSEPIAGSTRRVKYRAPQPPTSVAPFRIADFVKNVAVASVGEVKVRGSPLGKRNDFMGVVNVPKITVENQDCVSSEEGTTAPTMTDNCMGETILERNGSAMMASHTSPKPVPSPRLSRAESMNRQYVGSPDNNRVVKRRSTDVTNSNSRLARSQPLPKMKPTLSPPVSYGDGHIIQLSDDCIDHKTSSASVKPTVHPRKHSDFHSAQVVGNDAHRQHSGNNNDTQKEIIRTTDIKNEQELKANSQSDLTLQVESDTHTRVASSVVMDTNTHVVQRVKPTITPRVIRPSSFNTPLKFDTVLPNKFRNNLDKTGNQTQDSNLRNHAEAEESISELVEQCRNNFKRNKGLSKNNSEEHSEGYHSAISSQVEDGADDHDDDDDIVLVSEHSPLNKTKTIHVVPVQSALSPTSPVRARHSSYLRAVYARSSTLSSNDSLDSVDEHPFGSSYGSNGTQVADDERSDTLGDSVGNSDLLSSTDSLAQRCIQSSPVHLRKKPQQDREQTQAELGLHRPFHKSISDSQRLAASCEALHDNLLRQSLPEEDLHNLRIQKSKSMLDVPEKETSTNNSPSSSPRSGSSSPRENRFKQHGFFSKFPRMQVVSPSLKRKTAPILEANEQQNKEVRKSTPIELFSKSPLNPNRLRPPDYETTLHNLVEGTTKVDREREKRLKRHSLQPADYHSETWLSGPEIRVKRPSISTAFDSDLSPDGNLASLNLEGLNQTYPVSKHGKKVSRSTDDWGTLLSPRYSRKSKGLTLSLTRRKENRQIDPNFKVKDSLLLFPAEGFTSTLPDVCFVIDLDTSVEETCFETDFEVRLFLFFPFFIYRYLYYILFQQVYR
jgi:hypothetical protein